MAAWLDWVIERGGDGDEFILEKEIHCRSGWSRTDICLATPPILLFEDHEITVIFIRTTSLLSFTFWEPIALLLSWILHRCQLLWARNTT
jgi:hypothetical protein